MRENMQQQALLTCTQILKSAVLMQSKIRTYVKRLFHMELSLLRKTKVCQKFSSHPCKPSRSMYLVLWDMHNTSLKQFFHEDHVVQKNSLCHSNTYHCCLSGTATLRSSGKSCS